MISTKFFFLIYLFYLTIIPIKVLNFKNIQKKEMHVILHLMKIFHLSISPCSRNE